MKIKNNDSSVLILETGTNNEKCPRLEFRRKDSTISTSSIHMDSYGLVISNSIESTTPGGGITFQTGGTNRGFYNAISRFQITKDGNLLPKTNKTYNIGSDGKKIKDVHVSGLFVSDSIILGEVPFKTIKSTGGDLSIFIGSSVPKIDKSNAKSNIAIGDSALYNNTSGGHNNAFGSYALKKNTTGSRNNAFGYGALYNNETGNNNIAIGDSALYNNESGDGNVAHGSQVGDTLTTGDSNVIIGSKADVSAASAKNQIVIGAGAKGMGDSTVVLGDSLTIKSTYLHGDININRKYTIPKVDGNKGNVLKTDGEGTVSWDSTSIDDLHDVLLKDSSLFLGTEPQSINNARHNTAIGIKVFNNVTDGKNNTIMGFNAASTLTTGDSNVVIGYEANVNNANALNRIVIGARAIGFRDSTVVLGDSLSIQETFLHGNININREYILPKTPGTSGQILKYPTSGKTLEWGEATGSIRINNLVDAKTEDSSIYIGTVPSGTISTSTRPLRNTAIGIDSLKSVDSGMFNVANGFQALYSNTKGSFNVANGFRALYSNTTGYNNVANGYRVLYNNTTGNDNIANGTNALSSNTTGDANIANGTNALFSNTTGYYNVANGPNALYTNTTGYCNTASGYRALYTNTTGILNLAIGCTTLDVNTTGSRNIGLGTSSLAFNTKGHGNVGVGYRSLFYNNYGSTDSVGIVLSAGTLWNNNTPTYSKYGNIGIGTRALYSNETGNNNIGLGTSTMDSTTTGGSNVAIGHGTMRNNTTGSHNTVIGFRAGDSIITGDNNIIIGNRARVDNTDAQGQIVIGAGAKGMEDYSVVLGDSFTIQRTYLHGTVNIDRKYILPSTAGTGGQVLKYPNTGKTLIWADDVTGVGGGTSTFRGLTDTPGAYGISGQILTTNGSAISWQTPTSVTELNDLSDILVQDSSIYIGTVPSGTNSTSARPLRNTAIGIDSLKSVTNGMFNVANGFQALYSNTTGYNNVANGYRVLYNNTTGYNNVANGSYALYWNTTGEDNVASGKDALYSNTTGYNNVASGWYALRNNTTGINNTASGSATLEDNTTGNGNTALGSFALCWNTTGSYNTAIGRVTLSSNITGSYNIGLGTSALAINTKGHGNIGVGYRSLFNNGWFSSDSIGFVLSAGSVRDNNTPLYSKYGNIGIGLRAIYSNKTGNNNIGIGTSTMDSTTTGGSNVAIGHGTMRNNTTGGNNTVMGFRAGDSIITGNYNVVIGNRARVDNTDAQGQIVIGARAKGMEDYSVVLGDSLTIQKTYLHGTVNIDRKYILPSTAGTSGQVLKYPAAGKTLEWVTRGNLDSLIINNTEVDLTSGSAIDLTKFATGFKTTAAETATLGTGTEGQIITLYMHTYGGNMVVIVTNPGWKGLGTGTITFNAIGQICKLQYLDSKWFAISTSTVAFA